PLVRLAWGSTSTTRTRRPASARDAATLMVVVVLPTPPFWLATARIRLISGNYQKSDVVRGSERVAGRIEGRPPRVKLERVMFHVEHMRRPRQFRRSAAKSAVSDANRPEFLDRGQRASAIRPARAVS